MLRWTFRLRDALERRAFLFKSSQTAVEELREAEFVSSTNGGFPSEFRWDTFLQCTAPIRGLKLYSHLLTRADSISIVAILAMPVIATVRVHLTSVLLQGRPSLI
jgi:hypothetical protein